MECGGGSLLPVVRSKKGGATRHAPTTRSKLRRAAKRWQATALQDAPRNFFTTRLTHLVEALRSTSRLIQAESGRKIAGLQALASDFRRVQPGLVPAEGSAKSGLRLPAFFSDFRAQKWG